MESLDAAIILQFHVGLDPAPFAPLPWQEWRLTLADVDNNQAVEAYDASLILQYYVDLISTFPVENNSLRRLPNLKKSPN